MKDLLQLILMIIPIIVALTNIVVNCIKDVKEVKSPKALVLIVSIVLCILAAVGLIIFYGWAGWQIIVAAIVIAVLAGFVLAHVAMYGYDEGYNDFITLIKNLISYILCGGNVIGTKK